MNSLNCRKTINGLHIIILRDYNFYSFLTTKAVKQVDNSLHFFTQIFIYMTLFLSIY